MYILVAYDVETSSPLGCKRLRKVAKECLNYGQRVQNSVFECLVDGAQYATLKHNLISIIDKKADSIRIYFLGKKWETKIETIGRTSSFTFSSEIII